MYLLQLAFFHGYIWVGCVSSYIGDIKTIKCVLKAPIFYGRKETQAYLTLSLNLPQPCLATEDRNPISRSLKRDISERNE